MIAPRIMAGAVAALALSGLLHAAAVLVAVPQDEPVLLAGGGVPEVAAIGAAFADFAAGAVPVPVVTQSAVPVSAAQPSVTPTAADRVDPVLPIATAPVPDRISAIAQDAAPESSVRPVPRPAPRPQPPARPAGNAQTDARRGAAQGQIAATGAATTSAPAPAAAAGQAEASNYPGEVLRRITRLRRSNTSVRGTVTISFSIASSGALADVAVARTSGSAALDRMALDHIRRAAPFAPPPAGAQTRFTFEFAGRS